jgi:hypothetical protein
MTRAASDTSSRRAGTKLRKRAWGALQTSALIVLGSALPLAINALAGRRATSGDQASREICSVSFCCKVETIK